MAQPLGARKETGDVINLFSSLLSLRFLGTRLKKWIEVQSYVLVCFWSSLPNWAILIEFQRCLELRWSCFVIGLLRKHVPLYSLATVIKCRTKINRNLVTGVCSCLRLSFYLFIFTLWVLIGHCDIFTNSNLYENLKNLRTLSNTPVVLSFSITLAFKAFC